MEKCYHGTKSWCTQIQDSKNMRSYFLATGKRISGMHTYIQQQWGAWQHPLTKLSYFWSDSHTFFFVLKASSKTNLLSSCSFLFGHGKALKVLMLKMYPFFSPFKSWPAYSGKKKSSLLLRHEGNLRNFFRQLIFKCFFFHLKVLDEGCHSKERKKSNNDGLKR